MRLGASDMHSPTVTITHIDAYGQDETHTIKRAELGAIHVALDSYNYGKWIETYLCGLSYKPLRHTKPATTTILHNIPSPQS